MNTPQRADPQCTQKQAFDQRWSQKSVLLLDAEDDFFWEPSSQLVINNSLMWDDDDEYSFSPFTLYILLSKQEFPLFSKIMWIFHLFNHCFYYCA